MASPSAVRPIETDNATVSLAADLACPEGNFVNGVTITADNVTLNLRGYAIRGKGAGTRVWLSLLAASTKQAPLPCPASAPP